MVSHVKQLAGFIHDRLSLTDADFQADAMSLDVSEAYDHVPQTDFYKN